MENSGRDPGVRMFQTQGLQAALSYVTEKVKVGKDARG